MPSVGGQVVEARALREADRPEVDAVADDAAVAVGVRGLGDVGAFERRRGMDRHHDGDAVDGDGLVVGRTGAAAAAFDTGLRVNQPHAVGLQLVDQVFRRRSVAFILGAPMGNSLHRRGGAVVEQKLQKFGAGVVADRIHHPLALGDQAHVEIGDEQALALRQGRNDVAALGRNDRGEAAAGQRLVQFRVGGDGGLLLVGQPAGGVDDEAAAFQRVVADRDLDLFGENRADEGAGELGDVDFLVLRHQGVAGERVVVFPAGQGADAAGGGVHDLQAGAVALAPDHALMERGGDFPAGEFQLPSASNTSCVL